MKVALDAGPLLDPHTGIGRYTNEIARGLRALGADVGGYAFALRGTMPGDLEVSRLRLPARMVQASWKLLGLPSVKTLVRGADVVHGTNFLLPPLGGIPGVVTVHDLSFHRSDTFPGGERLRTLVPWSVERATTVVVPTAAVGDEVAERYRLSPDRLRVIHEGVSDVFFGATPLSSVALGKMGIGGRFILSVGTLEPRKNLARLLEAWRIVRSEIASEWSLVIAGPKGWGPDLPHEEGVILLGWVGDETLPGLLAAADVFCYPSLYEGFGLPPLEAMAAGTATVVGDYSAAREVVGDGATIVDPLDPEAIAGGLLHLINDAGARKTAELSGRARAAGFTWSSCALATLDTYEAAIS